MVIKIYKTDETGFLKFTYKEIKSKEYMFEDYTKNYQHRYYYDKKVSLWKYIMNIIHDDEESTYYLDILCLDKLGILHVDTISVTEKEMNMFVSEFLTPCQIMMDYSVDENKKEELRHTIQSLLNEETKFLFNHDEIIYTVRMMDVIYRDLYKPFSYKGEQIKVECISCCNKMIFVRYESIKYTNYGGRRIISDLSSMFEIYVKEYPSRDKQFKYYEYNGDTNIYYFINNISDVEEICKLHTVFCYIGKKDDQWHKAIIIRNCLDEEHPYQYINEFNELCNIENLYGENLELDSY